MTKEQELAKEAGFDLDGMPNMLHTVRGNHAQLERLIKLVRNAALDEAALICFRNASFTGDTIDRARLLECGTAIRNIKDKTP